MKLVNNCYVDSKKVGIRFAIINRSTRGLEGYTDWFFPCYTTRYPSQREVRNILAKHDLSVYDYYIIKFQDIYEESSLEANIYDKHVSKHISYK